MKLIVAALICAAAGVVISLRAAVPTSARALPPARMGALQLCLTGGVELIDERCNANGCAKQSVRLAWDHGEGVLFEGDATGEQELRRIHAPELSGLLFELTALDPLPTDRDRGCGRGGWDSRERCEGLERAMTLTTACGDAASTFTFMGARPVWERIRTDCDGPWSAERAQCVARSTWQAAFTTHLAVRFGTVFNHLRGVGRGG